MAHTNYAYAVARIRANELQLFSNQLVEQLLATKSYDECLRMLLDKGWGDEAAAGIPTAEELLSGEREKTWALIGELCEDMSPFDVFLYANDYHNLKAAIKLVCTNTDDFGIFIKNGTVDCNRIPCAHLRRKPIPPCPRPGTGSYVILLSTALLWKPSFPLAAHRITALFKNMLN